MTLPIECKLPDVSGLNLKQLDALRPDSALHAVVEKVRQERDTAPATKVEETSLFANFL